MLDFLYKGETNVFQDDLDQFLSLAEDFQLKGLTGSDQDQKNRELDINSSTKLHSKPTSMGDRNRNHEKGAKSIEVERRTQLHNDSSSEMRLANPNNQLVRQGSQRRGYYVF